MILHRYGLFILGIFCLSCQPLKIEYLAVEDTGALPQASEGLISQEQPLRIRSYQKHYEDRFISDKVDMVFILDTEHTRASFYEQVLFKTSFLDQFSDYDWKWAYTDMSADTNSYLKQEEQQADSAPAKKSCNFLSNALLTGASLLIETPQLAVFGLRGLGSCFKSSNKKISYANGYFMPLEQKESLRHVLTKESENYNSIFNDTLKRPNPKDYKYQAPVSRKSSSYPMLSLMLSLSHNLDSQSPFFREDSLIVYVVFSFQDMKINLSAQALNQSLTESFGTEKRFKMIPVTITENSNLFCAFSQENNSPAPKKLTQLAKDRGQKVLDICSQNLSQELFLEISKNLSSSSSLDEEILL